MHIYHTTKPLEKEALSFSGGGEEKRDLAIRQMWCEKEPWFLQGESFTFNLQLDY